jgi:GNAT superfamily N-acetyltransferase
LEENPMGLRICSGVPFPIFNWAFNSRFAVSDAEDLVRDTVRHFYERGVPFVWGIFPNDRPQGLREKLLSAGFVEDDAPAMAIDLGRLPMTPPPKELTIEPVRTRAQVDQFAKTLNDGDFQAAPAIAEAIPDVLRPSLSEKLAELDLRCFLGYLDGKAVATSAWFCCAGVVGVYGVATVPSARHRGIGAAMTLAALEDGRSLGFRRGVLVATKMGEPVYRRLGFEELFRVRQMESPAPPP